MSKKAGLYNNNSVCVCVVDIKKWMCVVKYKKTNSFFFFYKLLWMHQRNVQQTLKKRHFVCEKGKSDGHTYAHRTYKHNGIEH